MESCRTQESKRKAAICQKIAVLKVAVAEERILSENEEEDFNAAAAFQQMSTKKPVLKKPKIKTIDNEDNLLQKAVSFLGTASHLICKRAEKEPYSEEILSRYFASELHQIKDVHIKRLAKHKIEGILYEASCSSFVAAEGHISTEALPAHSPPVFLYSNLDETTISSGSSCGLT